MNEPSARKLTVFYDGACPLCDREISFYRRRHGAEGIDWVDLRECATAALPRGLERCDALARFRVRLADGRLVSGGAAFAALWASLPSFALLGRSFQWRPLAGVLEMAYPLFLKLRPTLQRLLPPRRISHGSP